ncbi:MAG: hypothetical protein EXR71_13730 [Myxococcales bacterium]|nr:hypothetical protein [Myxococcales bacterium]
MKDSGAKFLRNPRTAILDFDADASAAAPQRSPHITTITTLATIEAPGEYPPLGLHDRSLAAGARLRKRGDSRRARAGHAS